MRTLVVINIACTNKLTDTSATTLMHNVQSYRLRVGGVPSTRPRQRTRVVMLDALLCGSVAQLWPLRTSGGLIKQGSFASTLGVHTRWREERDIHDKGGGLCILCVISAGQNSRVD
ncbi:hypothetical protein H257_10451 [Aphanomyces astaci]|uniref:Uncharacterized protein n=1 Tax=Aphanomyces astaci TaxID=112090 RepID=W4G6F7_APHAT|nr:hypothetical protein H257_10451 [Aphanomyces astaci]ETV75260.1 hypothetical protein H257_10451 [Aphanomyces astaci]|eukprot:XP_009835308.1 hypothetical protein H257_10451 [Aphanomyces astaci]